MDNTNNNEKIRIQRPRYYVEGDEIDDDGIHVVNYRKYKSNLISQVVILLVITLVMFGIIFGSLKSTKYDPISEKVKENKYKEILKATCLKKATESEFLLPEGSGCLCDGPNQYYSEIEGDCVDSDSILVLGGRSGDSHNFWQYPPNEVLTKNNEKFENKTVMREIPDFDYKNIWGACSVAYKDATYIIGGKRVGDHDIYGYASNDIIKIAEADGKCTVEKVNAVWPNPNPIPFGLFDPACTVWKEKIWSCTLWKAPGCISFDGETVKYYPPPPNSKAWPWRKGIHGAPQVIFNDKLWILGGTNMDPQSSNMGPNWAETQSFQPGGIVTYSVISVDYRSSRDQVIFGNHEDYYVESTESLGFSEIPWLNIRVTGHQAIVYDDTIYIMGGTMANPNIRRSTQFDPLKKWEVFQKDNQISVSDHDTTSYTAFARKNKHSEPNRWVNEFFEPFYWQSPHDAQNGEWYPDPDIVLENTCDCMLSSYTTLMGYGSHELHKDSRLITNHIRDIRMLQFYCDIPMVAQRQGISDFGEAYAKAYKYYVNEIALEGIASDPNSPDAGLGSNEPSNFQNLVNNPRDTSKCFQIPAWYRQTDDEVARFQNFNHQNYWRCSLPYITYWNKNTKPPAASTLVHGANINDFHPWQVHPQKMRFRRHWWNMVNTAPGVWMLIGGNGHARYDTEEKATQLVATRLSFKNEFHKEGSIVRGIDGRNELWWQPMYFDHLLSGTYNYTWIGHHNVEDIAYRVFGKVRKFTEFSFPSVSYWGRKGAIVAKVPEKCVDYFTSSDKAAAADEPN